MKIVGDAANESGRGRPQMYPWDEWFSAPNKKVRLYQGQEEDDDFTIEPSALRPQIHSTAKKRNGRVSTRLGTDEAGRRYVEIVYKPMMSEEEVAAAFTFEKDSEREGRTA